MVMRDTLTRIEAGIFDMLLSPSTDSYNLGIQLLGQRKPYTRNHIVSALIQHIVAVTMRGKAISTEMAKEQYVAIVGIFMCTVSIGGNGLATVNIHMRDTGNVSKYVELELLILQATKFAHGKVYKLRWSRLFTIDNYMGTWVKMVNTRYHGDNIWRIFHKIMRHE